MSPSPSDTNAQLVASLVARIRTVIGALLPEGSRCALVNYPNHWNTGDPAIWLGTLAVLEWLGVDVVYQCEWRTYDAVAMSSAVRGGPILIAGGGNLGDLWVNPQRFRERVLEDFPDNPVIQLPQSVWFEKRAGVEHFRRLCEGHSNFHLLLREVQSLELARERFDVHSTLCPDLAFALGRLKRPIPAIVPIFWLARSDKESAGHTVPACEDLECRDWLTLDPEEWDRLPHTGILERNARLTGLMEDDPEAARSLWRRAQETFEPIARLRLDRGCGLLSRGRVVITDRLHGHILCCCMSLPHVVLDNSYGKVKSTYETWTSSSPITRWADSPQEALELARSMAEAG